MVPFGQEAFLSRKRTSEEGVRPEWRHAVKARLNPDTRSYYLFDSADPKVPLSQSRGGTCAGRITRFSPIINLRCVSVI